MRPLIIQEQSRVLGKDEVEKMNVMLMRGDNVVLLSNHQTEADPQIVSILLEQMGMTDLAERIIFVAGHKVTNDRIAIPFSMVSCLHYFIFQFIPLIHNCFLYCRGVTCCVFTPRSTSKTHQKNSPVKALKI